MQSGFERFKPQQAFEQAGDMPVARRFWAQGKNGSLLVETCENGVSFI
jgi:hypothetical protein